MAEQTNIGQSLASIAQDLSALAAFFCVDSVEQNYLATQNGELSVAVSCLSILGLLGMIKGMLKVTLGPKICRAAGFNIEPIRGLFGYSKDEKAAKGNTIQCYRMTVTYSHEDIVINKEEIWMNDAKTPMISVGSSTNRHGKDRLKCKQQ
jgi:hypothetical protein